jgi:hypothetical protein
MNEPANVSRQPVHTRQVICTGYVREDGLLEIEGRLLDTRARHSGLFFKDVPAGGAIHAMRVIVTVGPDLVVRHVEAQTETGPTPYCAQINAAYKQLVGIAFSGGFMKEVKARLGGAKGCTHLTELLGPIATTAIQTRMALQSAERAVTGPRPAGDDARETSMRDTCYAWREEGDVMQIVRARRASADLAAKEEE